MAVSSNRTILVCAALLTGLVIAPPASARWADWPAGPSDADLEQIVRVAYSAAATHARRNTNYFARDGVTEPLRSVIEDELGRQSLTSVNVVGKPSADLAAARMCAEQGTELRFAVNLFGDGISLAAATGHRVFSYHYDPHVDAAIVGAPAEDCVTK